MLKIIIFASLVVGLFTVNYVHAKDGCQPIFGGGENCKVSNKIKIDKKVQSPTNSSFSDNLGSSVRFSTNDILNFQIIITNLTKNSLKNLEIKDNLPNYLTFVSGPGEFDSKTKTLTIKLTELKASESRKFVVVGKIDSTPNPICLTNFVEAKVGNEKTDDNARFCLTGSVNDLPIVPGLKGISQTPATGPEMISILGLISAALAGIFLRKKA